MSGDVHVRFCERLGGQFPGATRLVILSRSREEAEEALAAISAFLQEKLKLRLNPNAGVSHIGEGFTFLGITFCGRERSVSDEKLASIREKIRNAVSQDRLQGMQKLDDLRKGLLAYYAKVLPPQFVEKFDEAIAEALKATARRQVEKKALKSRRALKDFLGKLEFLSAAWQTRRNKEIREIVDFAFRREPKNSGEAPAAEPKPSPAGRERRVDPVAKRKRQYQKLEAEGFELVVSRPGAFVGKTQKGIVVKVGGKILYQAPLNNLKHIMITSRNVSLSGAVIAHAVKTPPVSG